VVSLPKAMIVDLDGTLCDHRHRIHLAENGDYECFYAAMSEDKVNIPIREIIRRFGIVDQGWRLYELDILFFTGRPKRYREKTINWLNEADLDTSYTLFMRPDYLPGQDIYFDLHDPSQCNIEGCDCRNLKTDNRPAHIVKKETYESQIKNKYDVLFVIDDSEECCQMYKNLGLTVLKVM